MTARSGDAHPEQLATGSSLPASPKGTLAGEYEDFFRLIFLGYSALSGKLLYRV